MTATARGVARRHRLDPPWARRPAELKLPTTMRMLTEGGDARIILDPSRGLNKYGCSPTPDPELAEFGSSTASTVSEAGFAAAGRLRDRLVDARGAEAPEVTYARELERVRRELAELCGIADLSDLGIVFAASGTDLHLLAGQLVASGAPSAPRTIMVEAAETGSGVPAALAGRHFSTRTALGEAVSEGSPLGGAAAVEVAAVSSRAVDGMPRPAALIDAEVESLVADAISAGWRVLLTVVDVSKTGIIAPSPATALGLARRWPSSVDVLVDACQFRLSTTSLRAYLEHGFMVAVTGSKFMTGPTFSGALLVPGALTRRLHRRPLPPSLRAYSARADWPSDWAAAQSLAESVNYGLLLRWEAALEELRIFGKIPDAEVAAILSGFARAIEKQLASDPAFEPLPVPALDRHPLVVSPSWDQIPTIFPFLLRQDGTGSEPRWLDRAATAGIYGALTQDASRHALNQGDGKAEATASLRCQVGQPVPCGIRDGIPVSALRLCASARLVVAAARDGGGAAVIAQALRVLDKVAWFVRTQSADDRKIEPREAANPR